MISLALFACRPAEPTCLDRRVEEAPVQGYSPNVVLVVLDDVGVDKLGVYGVNPRPAPTPVLDALSAESMRFVSAYAEPVCSESRGALLTGRRPVRTGLGTNIYRRSDVDLPDSEVLVPELLAPAGYATVAVGKWHLSVESDENVDAPLRQGFQHFDGILGNPVNAVHPDGDTRDYFHWEHDVDGVLSWSDDYIVSNQADAAIDALETLPEPFFLYLAFTGAHDPLHIPPPRLWSQADPKDDAGEGDAMIEALDHELGRVLDAVGDRATVVVLSDNGTSPDIVRPPSEPNRSKKTVFQAGVHVPLLIRGPGIEPGTSDALVHETDLLPTILDLAGVDLPQDLDGTSLIPLLQGQPRVRRCVVVDHFFPNGATSSDALHYDVSLLEPDFELVRRHGHPDALYVRDPTAPVEGKDLLRGGSLSDEARDALSRMRRWLRHDARTTW